MSHCNRSLQRQGMFEGSRYIEAFGSFTHAFVMALFFFVSGLFITSWAARPVTAFLSERGRSIVYPYFLWVWIHGLALIVAGNLANHAGSFEQLFMAWYRPPFHFWFLYTLFFMSLIWVLLRKVGLGTGAVFIVALVWWLTQDLFGLSWAGYYLPQRYLVYFALGALVGRGGAIRQFSKWPDTRLLITAVAGLGTVFLVGWILQRHADDYSRLVLAFMGGAGALSLATWLQRHRRARFIEFLGRRSLEIFLAHALFAAAARAFLIRGFGITQPYLLLVLIIAAGILGPLALRWAAMQAGFPYLFTLKRLHAERPVQGGLTVPAK